jgi:hypothetical protein
LPIISSVAGVKSKLQFVTVDFWPDDAYLLVDARAELSPFGFRFLEKQYLGKNYPIL